MVTAIRRISNARRAWIIGLTLVALASLMGEFAGNPAAGGEDPPAPPPKKRALFDGKSLDGWKKTESFKAGEVKVEEGTILMEAGGPMSGVTSTRTDLPTVATTN